MVEVWAYAFGIMYSPGPVNLLGLHSGIKGKTSQHLGFFAGVATAMFILFIMLSFIGRSLVNDTVLPFISLLGCSYILYIAWKLWRAEFQATGSEPANSDLTFRDGLVLQLLNPKGLIATLPIATIQFPALGITGLASVYWSVALALFAFGAPGSYSLAGLLLGQRIENPRYFRLFNLSMAVLLVYVAGAIGYEHVYSAWFGAN